MPNEHCYVLARGGGWFLIQKISEFHLDGFSLIAEQTVESIRYNKFDKKLEQILVFGGVDKKVQSYELSLNGNIRLFGQLMNSGQLISLEDEADDGRYVIGKIRKVQKKQVSFQHFDAAGKWFKRNTVFEYSEMTKVSFGGEYEIMWQRYLEEGGAIL
ncbi:MAG: hypothetical protein QM496_01495 [Verrucomicrobiota bacterium]